MQIREWLTGVNYKLICGDLNSQVEEVVYDSRKAASGAVFVCMKGTKVDSHRFIPDVCEKGVKVLITEREVNAPEGVTVIQVENSRKALAYLSAARFGNPVKQMISIGVTGTKGKTTTTHMMKAVLEAAGKKVGMIGTTGAVIGKETFPTRNTTPESYELHQYFYEMKKAGCEYVIMEVSSQGFKMDRVAGITFDYGVFTNISPDHIGPDEHADFLEYLSCKAMLFKQCRIGLYNGDDSHGKQIIDGALCKELFSFGIEGGWDYDASHIRHVSEKGFVGMEFHITGKEQLKVRLGMPGRFNIYNSLAAAALGDRLGLEKEAVLKALKEVWVNGRMEIAYSSHDFTVIIDYAHNAVSMESLLTTLREYNPKRLVCVFGCGGNRSKDRRYSMGEIGGKMADLCILTADNSRFEKTEDIINDIKGSLEKTGGAYVEIPDRREAIEYSMAHACPGDLIAVIGKGHEDYQEANGVRTHFLDREVVEETAKKLGLQ